MVRLGVMLVLMKKVNDQCFNSSMVRLGARNIALKGTKLYRFNSSMVRLGEKTLNSVAVIQSLFQFQYGAIRRTDRKARKSN